jgi:GntR family transcriptional regulator
VTAVRFFVNASAGQPLYVQLILQIRHAIETGLLQAGDALPGVRVMAQDLVMSPNTVVKAYDELERDGWIDIRQGAGAYVAQRRGMKPRADRLRSARDRVRALVACLQAEGFSDEEVRCLFEAELLYSMPTARRRP